MFTQHFKSSCPFATCLTAALTVIALAFPLTAFSMVAGRADFVIGKVEAMAADGIRRTLSKGSEINTGETISTDTNARAQLRFTDGGFISLQPNTIFRVDEFNYQSKTDGAEKGFFSLLKGGLRAITGAIGRVNRDTYRVTTPVATIGIRGTGYNAELSDGLFINVGDGSISLTNNAGLLLVTAGNAAYVANINTPPAFSTRHPRNPPAGMRHLRQMRQFIAEYIAGDQRDADGNLITLPRLASGPGYAMSYAYMQCGDGCFASGSNGLTGVAAVFNPASQLLGYVESTTEGGSLGTATVSFSVTDGIIGWGRWAGTTDVPAGLSSTVHPLSPGFFDYVIGKPTAAMPISGTATYNLMGHTKPTATDGSTPDASWMLAGANLTANFSSSQVTVNLSVTNGTNSYAIVNRPIAITGATFSSGATALPVTGPCTSCSASVNGFFAGASAERAGLSYSITNPAVINIQGVAAFASTGIVPPLPPSLGM